MRKIPALTLVEILLVVALLSIIVTGAMSSLVRARLNQALMASAEKFAIVVRQAHIFAREERDDRAWGVKYEGVDGYSLIVDGGNLDVRSSYKLEKPSVFGSDFGEIVFAQGTGELTDGREIVVRSTDGREVKINILKTGVVEVKRI